MLIALSFTIPVTKDILKLLLDSTPENLDIKNFTNSLMSLIGVKEVHDLHIWNLTFGKPTLTCHILCDQSPGKILKQATILCRKQGIYHSTIQVELEGPKLSIDCTHNVHS